MPNNKKFGPFEVFGPFKSSVPIPARKPDPDEIGLPLVNQHMIDFIKRHEGVFDHLYKDTKDNVTIGVGFNVNKQPKAAYDLPLYWPDSKGTFPPRRATLGEVTEALRRVETMSPGYRADFYDPAKPQNQKLLNVRMKKENIDEVLRKKLLSYENELRTSIHNFDNRPYPARQAFLDMQFNMGAEGFSASKWPELYKQIDFNDYRRVAEESHRKDVTPERNRSIYNLLMEADRIEKRRKN